MSLRLLVLLVAVVTSGLSACSDDDSSTGDVVRSPRPSEAAGEYAIGPGDEYVALGDSYTAAPGTGPVDKQDGCARSTRNYPHQVAEATGVQLRDVSCSAASSDALSSPQQTAAGNRPPQLDAITSSTDLVTLGIGGNDFNIFGTLVIGCVMAAQSDPEGSPCADQAEGLGPDAFDRTMATIADRIAEYVDTIEERAPDAEVMVVGYPQIVPERGTCEALPIARGDYAYARGVNEALNDALEQGAARAGAEFVDVYEATEGHDICAADPWVAGANGGSGATSWHPYLAEQEKVAELILDALENPAS